MVLKRSGQSLIDPHLFGRACSRAIISRGVLRIPAQARVTFHTPVYTNSLLLLAHSLLHHKENASGFIKSREVAWDIFFRFPYTFTCWPCSRKRDLSPNFFSPESPSAASRKFILTSSFNYFPLYISKTLMSCRWRNNFVSLWYIFPQKIRVIDKWFIKVICTGIAISYLRVSRYLNK